MSETIYRVQDHEGRGPYRPGFSARWVDEKRDFTLPSWLAEFGPVHRRVLTGCSMGTGCRTLQQLRRWFTPTEYAKLRSFGYHAVKMDVGRVLAESECQLVFERAKPLHVDFTPVELYAESQTIAKP